MAYSISFCEWVFVYTHMHMLFGQLEVLAQDSHNHSWRYCNQHICSFTRQHTQTDKHTCPHIIWSVRADGCGIYGKQKISKRLKSLPVFSGIPWRMRNTFKHPNYTGRMNSLNVEFSRMFNESLCFGQQQFLVLPWPIKAPCSASLAVPKPSSLHTTLAAVLSHKWSTIVPHFPSRSTSTRPSPSLGPTLRRTGCIRQQRENKNQFTKKTTWLCKCRYKFLTLPQLDRALEVFLKRCEQTEVLVHTWPLHVSHFYKG